MSYLRTSENMIWRVRCGEDSYVLRCHRPQVLDCAALPALGREEIEAELKWLAALGSQLPFQIPAPVATRDGALVMPTRSAVGHELYWTMLKWVPGRQYRRGIRPIHLKRAGMMAALLHNAARAIGAPPWPRPRWDQHRLDRALGELQPAMDARQLPDETIALLMYAHGKCSNLMDCLISDSDRGYIHADLNINNMVFRGDSASPIDFCSSGHGWVAFELAQMIAFAPTLDNLEDCMDGYST